MVSRAAVERFFAALVNEIRDEHSEYLEHSFTVAEIYQKLVPYRTHRDAVGVEINADYEDVLLRLLAGEGDFLVLESEPARRRIREELAARNPNTGIYREYAAVGVRLNSDLVPAVTGDDARKATNGKQSSSSSAQSSFEELELAPPSREAQHGGGVHLEASAADPEEPVGPSGAPSSPSARQRAGGDHGQGPAPADAGANRDAGPGADRGTGEPEIELQQCPDCKADLPDRDSLRFCPFCGTNVYTAPCGHCGEELERSWRFCLACGIDSRT